MELQPLTSVVEVAVDDAEKPVCIQCLIDNVQHTDAAETVLVPICHKHNCYIHLHCISSLMGHNFWASCPSGEVCHCYKPQLLVHGVFETDLHYTHHLVSKVVYRFWFFAVVISIFLAFSASISISECQITSYHSACFALGIAMHAASIAITVALFFYYVVDISTYVKYDSNLKSTKCKLITEQFVLLLSVVSGIPLVVMSGEIMEVHLMLSVYIMVTSGIINPIAAGALLYRIFQIYIAIDHVRVDFVPVIVTNIAPR